MFKPVLNEIDLKKIKETFNSEVVVNFEKMNDGYTFELQNIPIQIKLEIKYNPEFNQFESHISHHIKAPHQMGAYRPGVTIDSDIPYLINKAINALTKEYEIAISEGEVPNTNWLIAAK